MTTSWQATWINQINSSRTAVMGSAKLPYTTKNQPDQDFFTPDQTDFQQKTPIALYYAHTEPSKGK